MSELVYKELSYKIIGIAMKVYNDLGAGFLEKVYENAMMILFKNENIDAKQQESIDVYYYKKKIGHYVTDILVENKILIELKTVDKITKVHKAQLINYLKATNKKLGIIINFNKEELEFERVVL